MDCGETSISLIFSLQPNLREGNSWNRRRQLRSKEARTGTLRVFRAAWEMGQFPPKNLSVHTNIAQEDAHMHRLCRQLLPKAPCKGSGWMSRAKHRLIRQPDQSTGKSHRPTVLQPLDPGLTRSFCSLLSGKPALPSRAHRMLLHLPPGKAQFPAAEQLHGDVEKKAFHADPAQQLPGCERLIILPCSVLWLSSVTSSRILGAARHSLCR